jgi:hypothetical protein
MSLDNARYYGWRGQLRSPWYASLAIVRVTLLQVFRRKSYWFVLALGLLNFLLFWSLIYIVTQLGALGELKDRILDQFEFSAYAARGRENGYVVFMWRQSIVVMILLAFAGSHLVGSDFRFRSLPFYLSRRIDRRHYIVGKLLSIGALVALMTVAPALLLFVEYGMFTSNLDYWLDNWRIPFSVFGYGLVLCTVMSIWLVTLSAYLQKMAPIAITWASLFVMLDILATLMNDRSPYWNLVDPWRNMRYVGRLCFGTFDKPLDRELAWWAVGILTTLCALALAALAHRVRAVDIVE